MVLCTVWDYEAQNYQIIITLNTRTNVEFTTKTQMGYSTCQPQYEQLAYLELHVNDKLIFCEKPLFETYRQLDISQNRVYVGYVLRFHPLVQKMKTLLENEKIISVHAYCGQYLPTWRKEVDYKTTYSAKKAEGGGVLLDLSHEIDYIQWLFGTMREVQSYQLKISDLEIDSDDCVTCIAKTSHNMIVSVSMDYISKVTLVS